MIPSTKCSLHSWLSMVSSLCVYILMITRFSVVVHGLAIKLDTFTVGAVLSTKNNARMNHFYRIRKVVVHYFNDTLGHINIPYHRPKKCWWFPDSRKPKWPRLVTNDHWKVTNVHCKGYRRRCRSVFGYRG